MVSQLKMPDLLKELNKAYQGDAWHGSNVRAILQEVKPEMAFVRPVPQAHTIAEILLHMTGWTEEVTSRLAGGEAKLPLRGDWPVPSATTPEAWDRMLADFYRSNEQLLDCCAQLSEEQWHTPFAESRSRELGTGVSKRELLNGLIQHHAYHAGQIALLAKYRTNDFY